MDENNNRKGHSYTSKGHRGKRGFSKRGHGKPGFSGGRGAGHGKDFKDGKGNSAGNWNPVLNS